MVEKITKYKKYILGVIGILLTLTMVVGVKYLVKPKYEELPEVKLVKLKDIKSNKSFAIMVQKGDSYEEYTSEDNTWPGADYVYKEAKCIDNNGSLVNNVIIFADGKVTLTANQTIYCTLYFDIKPKSTTDILREKDPSGSLSTDLQGGMYRYQGTDNVPNWICFGTRAADTYNGDKMYAIETGKEDTTHYVGTKGNITQEIYKWPETNKVKAKISLMYLHDVAYAYYDGSQESARGDPGSSTNVQNSWIHSRKDGYNTSSNSEWLSTRWGVRDSNGGIVEALRVTRKGEVSNSYLRNTAAARPVFFINSNVKIASGDGTKENPYILEITKS